MRCPACRAANDRGPSCRRCRADLALLFELEAERDGLLARARGLTAENRWEEALDRARRANALRADECTRRLLAVCHLMRRDFAAAWRCYTRLGRAPTGEGPADLQ